MTHDCFEEEKRMKEPVPGLPEKLPEGEQIIWQGKPHALTLAVHAFHIRFVALYFVLFTLWRIAAIASRDGSSAEMIDVVTTSTIAGAGGIALLIGLTWLMARATIYTITNKRVAMRYGVAIRKYVNIPFAVIGAAALKRHGGDAGSIALSTSEETRIGYLHLWPHARPLRFNKPQPMLRAVAKADNVAQTLCTAMKEFAPASVSIQSEPSNIAALDHAAPTKAAVA